MESIQPTPPSSDAPQTKGRPLIIGGGKPVMMGAGVGVSLTMAVRPQMANVATGGSSGKMSSQAGGGQLAWRKPKAQGARGAHAQTQPYSLRPTFGGARAPPPPPPPMMTQPDIWKNSNANTAAASPLTLLAARNPLPPVMTDRAAMAPAPAYDDILASPRVENNTLAVKVLPFSTQRKVAFAGKREQEQQHAGVRIDEGAVMETTTITPSIAPKPDGMSYINLLHTLRRYPHSTDFVYLRQVQADENRYNPYALEVVPFSAIDADKTYYTLSARGMTMYSNGAKDADFTTLGTWEREFQLFHAMRCLRVFNHFRMWKGLITWRNSVRRNKIGKARQRLEENLFSLNPVFQGSVRQIMDLCSNFATTRLHKIATGRTYTLEEFKLGHREHLAEVAETVTNLGEMTRETVLKACRVVLKELEDRTNAFYADRDESKMLPSERIASQREGGVKASKSDFAFTIAATRRSEQRKLVHFVRMVDFMICNTLSSMLHESVYDVLDTIRGARECHEFYHPRQRHESEVDDEEEDDDDDDVHGDLDGEMNADADHQNEEGMPPAEAAGEEPSNGNATDAVAEEEVPIDEAGAAAAASADSEVPYSEEPMPLQQEGEQEQEEEEEERVHPRGGVDMAPLFTIEVLLDESHTSLQLVPGVEEVDGELQDILKEFKSTLAMFPRLTESEEITELTRGKAPKESDESAQTNGGVVAVATSGGAEDEITPLDEILEDETYTTLMSGVQEEMELGLEAAEDGRESFQPFTEIVNENRALDSDELRTSFIGGTRTLEDFRSDIREFREQRKRIEDLPTTTNLGMYSLNSHRLKDLFLPSPIDCLEKLFAVLPRIGSELYSALIEKVHTSTSKLNQALNNVEDFVEVVNFSEELKAASTEMYQDYDRVEKVYSLCEEFEIPVPEIERAAVQTLEGDYNAMVQALENVDTTMEENVTRFSGELEAAADAVRKAVKKIVVNTEDERILSDDSDSAEVIEFMQTIRDEVEEQRSDAQRVMKYQRLFKIMESEFEELDALHDDVEVKYSLWAGSRDWKELTEAWIATPFEAMDMADFEEKLQVYGKASFKCEKNLPRNGVSTNYKEAVQVYKDIYPCVESMRNKALKERHWTAIETIVNKPITRDENFTLGVVIEYNMMAFKDEIMAISTEATQEAALEDLLDKVKSRWATIDFQFLPYKDSKDTYILGGIDDIMVALEDSLMTMQTILASRFVAGIRDSVEAVDKQLNLFSDTLDEWLSVQRAWMYLDVIFSAPDIQRQLPNESKAFFNVDKQLKEIMKRARDKGNALQSGTTPGWLEILQRANETLEKVQKNLEDYLETKRMAFPRFYFLSNDELLEILAQTKNVQAVQPHMSKCFDGIKSLDFGRDPKSIDIFAMISAEGESVSLGKNLKARGNVEMWLGQVEQAMQMNLKRLAKQAFVDYLTVPRPEWVLQQPAQIVLAISQHYWVQDVEAAIQSEDCVKSLHEFLDANISQLSDLSRVVRGDLSNLHRKIVVALITIDVHARDIVESLEAEKCENLNDFIWQMQLRYFWDEEADNLFVKQTNATFIYMYEYLGAQSRLVVTPMTDRCYMTLTGALHLKFGGAPAGPAGTGKTETTKDLGKALGVQCVVFNCGDNLDYKFMAKFFSGLAQCGAWACFDEFNRIDIEVLSVVAQQLLTIQNALKAEVSKFNFEGKEIRLIPTFGCFITMNPGYAGRTELPDNLKALFRPMSMMIPDYALVAEVMLYAEGFETSKSLSRKMVKLYKLSSEQLSQQDHYDFGMRALKSVLVMAGSLKRANPDDPEDVTLIRAMRDSNIPKFLKEDAALFRAIVEDLFPGVEVPLNDYGDLQKAVEASLLAAGKQLVDDFVLKTIQLHETFNVRFGVMLVGPTGGGKTVVYETLKAAMTMLREQKHKDDTYQVTHTYTFNPKCIKMGELYGEYNLMTNEWTDGLGSTLIRNAVADTTNDRKWVVFDGPVDAIWIENMNTVLDDNCTLCLPNGERIKLNPVTMRMLFEVQDLSVASPATVSRCGMVYVPPEELGWRPFVQSWVARDLPEAITPELRAHIFNLFDTLVDAGLSFVATKRHSGIPTVDINLVTSLCYIMQSFFLPAHGINFASPPEELNPIIGRVFAFSYVWSIGANVHADSHDELDDFVREHLQPVCQFPGGGSVMDYVLDFTTPEVPLVQWTVPEFVYDLNTPFFQLIVPTIDTVRFGYLIETLLDVQRPVLYTGETGVGKSVIVDSTLKRLSNDKGVVPTTLNFSAQTQAIDVQFSIEAKLEKKRKTRFGAPPNKRNAFFVDDVNMPAKETYGAQPPVELLRLFIDRGGLYDRGKGLYWKTVEDTVVVCACGPPGGGRNDLSPRFVRCFTTVCVPPPSENALKVIFGSILRGFITDIGFKEEFKSVVDPIVNSTVDMFGRVLVELLPTPSKPVYLFNSRDIGKIVQGILMIKPGPGVDKETMGRLWVHESMRVFGDRLVGDVDKEYFCSLISELGQKNFSGADMSKSALFEEQTIMFCEFLKMGLDPEDRLYEEAKDMDRTVKILEDYLEEYNFSSTTQMSLVFFVEAVENISRISRVLRQPRGNAMLIGVGGSGKQSLTRFAAHMAGQKCFSIELTRGYNADSFREDLRSLYRTAGIDGKSVTFLMTDNQVLDESFLEMCNGLLNSGDVPGLFPDEEKLKLYNEIRPLAEKAGSEVTKDALWRFFINSVLDRLHTVLTMSPVGDKFAQRCRAFPSLVNCCALQQIQDWPKDALLSVSKRFLGPVDLGGAEVNESICEMCTIIHRSVLDMSVTFYNELRRKYYVTPKSYLDLISLYQQQLAMKREEYGVARDRLLNGLQKLAETNDVVDTMQTELNDLQPILKEKSAATEVLKEQVSKDQAEAEKVAETVGKEEAIVKEQAAETKAIADDAQADLDKAMPALEAAVNSLKSLNKGDITEIKSFPKPPALVQMTMEAVCVLLQQKPDWDTAKKVLSDSNF
ncbi:dynein axonemal heavy chain [Pseudoscourfieldia marina]